VSNKDEVLLLLLVLLVVVVDRVSCIIRLCQGNNEITVSRFTAMPKKVSDFNRHFCSPSNTHTAQQTAASLPVCPSTKLRL
jgi:hypothetical protein